MTIKDKILVTGGLGYIGSHTVVALVRKGFDVVIIDDLSNSTTEVLDRIEIITNEKPKFYNSNVGNYKKTTEILKNEKISGVIHFAAHLLVDESVSNPLKYYENNITSLIQLLKAMDKSNVNKFIFSSSCTVYGSPKEMPVTEKTPIKKASSPYGNTKIIGEQIIDDYANSSTNFSSISLRYFNPVGAHKSGLIGELTFGKPKHIFPIISDAIFNKKSFNIFGNDYNTKDGTAIRDYIHVMDVAEAHVHALEKLFFDKNEKINEKINIGVGKGMSVLDIINEFEKKTNSKLNLKYSHSRKGDIPAIWADNKKAKDFLNWTPKHSLKEMISSELNWHQLNLITK